MTEQASEQDMAELLELLDWKFKTTMINMLRALMGKLACKNRCAM